MTLLWKPKLSILFDLGEEEVGCGCRWGRWGAPERVWAAAGVGGTAQVQGARAVPQHCEAAYCHTEPDRPSAARDDIVMQA